MGSLAINTHYMANGNLMRLSHYIQLSDANRTLYCVGIARKRERSQDILQRPVSQYLQKQQTALLMVPECTSITSRVTSGNGLQVKEGPYFDPARSRGESSNR